MQIQFLGHACFATETDEHCVISDPWFSVDGAFNSGWFQNPFNHHLADHIVEFLETKKALIYISHSHRDHFDRNFLSSLKGLDFQLVIPKYSTNQFREEIEELALGVHVHELEDSETLQHGPMALTMFIDDGLINKDSALLISANDTNFLNMNDCKIHDRLVWLKQNFGEIQIFAAQHSGATWHPHCYEYPVDKINSIAHRKKIGKFRSVKLAIEAIGARCFLPSAGPPIFIDPEMERLANGDVSIFSESDELIAYLEKTENDVQVLNIYPGMGFNAQESEPQLSPADEFARKKQQLSLPEYQTWYRDKLDIDFDALLAPKGTLDDIFANLGASLNRRLGLITGSLTIEHNLYVGLIEKPDAVWQVDPLAMTASKVSADMIDPENHYLVRYKAAEMELVLDYGMTWEDLSATFRAEIERTPDNYNTAINALLFADDEMLGMMFDYFNKLHSNNERIVVEVDGSQHEIDRYCPHQGADLTYGWAEDGNWVCPRHRWEFCIEEGGKCKQSKDSINALAFETES